MLLSQTKTQVLPSAAPRTQRHETHATTFMLLLRSCAWPMMQALCDSILMGFDGRPGVQMTRTGRRLRGSTAACRQRSRAASAPAST